MIDSILQDLRYAVRRLRNAAGFTSVIVLTLALGIGATAATFSLVDAAVLRPLPFPGADALVRLREVTPQGEGFSVSEPDYLDYARASRSLAAVGAMKPVQLTLTGAGDAIRLDGTAASSTLFGVLGIQPSLGRFFLPQEDREGQAAPVVVLSHALWQKRFGGDRAAVGRVIRLDDQPYTIIGVMGTDAAFPPGDVWIPLGASGRADRTDRWLDVVGRLAPGASLEQARSEAGLIAAGLARDYPELQGWSAQVVMLSDWLIGPGLRRMVWVLLGAVACTARVELRQHREPADHARRRTSGRNGRPCGARCRARSPDPSTL